MLGGLVLFLFALTPTVVNLYNRDVEKLLDAGTHSYLTGEETGFCVYGVVADGYVDVDSLVPPTNMKPTLDISSDGTLKVPGLSFDLCSSDAIGFAHTHPNVSPEAMYPSSTDIKSGEVTGDPVQLLVWPFVNQAGEVRAVINAWFLHGQRVFSPLTMNNRG